MKFSTAISWSVVFWRSTSRSMIANSSSSAVRGPRHQRLLALLDLGDLVDAALRGGRPRTAVVEPQREDLVGQARRPRCGRPSTARWRRCAAATGGRCTGRCTARPARRHLVGGDLLALAAAAEHDAAVGLAADDGPADRGADRRVVDRLLAVGAEVDRPRGPARVSVADQVLLEREAGVVGPDGDPHRCASRRPSSTRALGPMTGAPAGRAGRRARRRCCS